MWATKVALEADYSVIAVARDLDPSLEHDVRHVPLHVPPAVFSYQWARALGTVRSALPGVEYDLLHSFQAQLTGVADTWHVCFLTRSAQQARSFSRDRDLRSRWRRSQSRLVALMEDRYLGRVTESVDVLFPSALMLREFSRLYGEPPRHQMLANPAERLIDLSGEERLSARLDLVGTFDGVVVGYLGGMDERKGWRELVAGVAGTPEAFLLFGGSGSEGFSDPRLSERCRSVGFVTDLTSFLAACDVLAVPSRFDPWAQVVTDAAARGVPSITTPMVGVQEEVLRYSAGVSWDGRAASFPAVLRTVAERHDDLVAGARCLAAVLDEQQVSQSLRRIWMEALVFKGHL